MCVGRYEPAGRVCSGSMNGMSRGRVRRLAELPELSGSEEQGPKLGFKTHKNSVLSNRALTAPKGLFCDECVSFDSL